MTVVVVVATFRTLFEVVGGDREAVARPHAGSYTYQTQSRENAGRLIGGVCILPDGVWNQLPRVSALSI